MWPHRVSNPGPLTYESDALPNALRGPAFCVGRLFRQSLVYIEASIFIRKVIFEIDKIKINKIKINKLTLFFFFLNFQNICFSFKCWFVNCLF